MKRDYTVMMIVNDELSLKTSSGMQYAWWAYKLQRIHRYTYIFPLHFPLSKFNYHFHFLFVTTRMWRSLLRTMHTISNMIGVVHFRLDIIKWMSIAIRTWWIHFVFAICNMLAHFADESSSDFVFFCLSLSLSLNNSVLGEV